MEKYWFVVCRTDVTPEDEKGHYVLAARIAWVRREDAEHFAQSCSPTREAIVVEAPRGLPYRVIA